MCLASRRNANATEEVFCGIHSKGFTISCNSSFALRWPTMDEGVYERHVPQGRRDYPNRPDDSIMAINVVRAIRIVAANCCGMTSGRGNGLLILVVAVVPCRSISPTIFLKILEVFKDGIVAYAPISGYVINCVFVNVRGNTKRYLEVCIRNVTGLDGLIATIKRNKLKDREHATTNVEIMDVILLITR